MRPMLAAVTAMLMAAPGLADAAPAPRGYTPCGFRGADGTYHQHAEPGASTVVFARHMSCRSARIHYERIKTGPGPRYLPRERGFRCTEVASGEEFADFACAKRARPNVAFRWQTGA